MLELFYGKVGGDLVNLGKFEVRERGIRSSKKHAKHGNITIDDPVTYKEIVLEGIKTTGNVAEFGTYVLRKLGIMP